MRLPHKTAHKTTFVQKGVAVIRAQSCGLGPEPRMSSVVFSFCALGNLLSPSFSFTIPQLCNCTVNDRPYNSLIFMKN